MSDRRKRRPAMRDVVAAVSDRTGVPYRAILDRYVRGHQTTLARSWAAHLCWRYTTAHVYEVADLFGIRTDYVPGIHRKRRRAWYELADAIAEDLRARFRVEDVPRQIGWSRRTAIPDRSGEAVG